LQENKKKFTHKHIVMLKRMLSCEPMNGGVPKNLEIILHECMAMNGGVHPPKLTSAPSQR
jgi:hypothetical protein